MADSLLLISQRITEIENHRTALQTEFKIWGERTKTEEVFKKHNSQIKRITRLLEAFLLEIPILENDKATFENTEAAYTFMLGAYRIWSFFREKIALRDVRSLQSVLQCADELAWRVYKPLYDVAEQADVIDVGVLKEPPLFFLAMTPHHFYNLGTRHLSPKAFRNEK